ncbi:MAG TPA: tetratricopeptide repeat protein [Ktedonobacteraceae bacterium]|nr:tetratricopeptide repeat protein [Ktedonobacteraceae bacterium]
MDSNEMNYLKIERARNRLYRGKLAHFQGAYAAARDDYQEALHEFERIHHHACGGQHDLEKCPLVSREIAEVWHQQAKLDGDMGYYETAEKLYLQVIPLRERLSQEQSGIAAAREWANTLYQLALLYHHHWQEYGEATRYYREAAKISSQHLGETSPETLQVTAGEALLELDQAIERQETNKFMQIYEPRTEVKQRINELRTMVEEKFLHALNACTTAPLPDRVAYGFLANNLAVIYQRNNKQKLADDWYHQAIDLYQRNRWIKHFSYAVLLTNYAHFLQNKKNDSAAAHTCYKEAEQIYFDALSKDYQQYCQVADFLYEYASVFPWLENEKKLQKLNRALNLYQSLKPGLGHERVILALKAYWDLETDDKERKERYGNLIRAYEDCLTSCEDEEKIGYSLQLASIQYHYAVWLYEKQKYIASSQIYHNILKTYQLSNAQLKKYSQNCDHLRIIRELHIELEILHKCVDLSSKVQSMSQQEADRYQPFINSTKRTLEDAKAVYELLPDGYKYLNVFLQKELEDFYDRTSLNKVKDSNSIKKTIYSDALDIQAKSQFISTLLSGKWRDDYDGLIFLW